MSAKFDEEAHNGSVSIVFTRSKRDGHTHGHTDGTTAALLYPLRNALRGDNNKAVVVCNTHAAFIAVFHGPAVSSTGGYERKKFHTLFPGRQ